MMRYVSSYGSPCQQARLHFVPDKLAVVGMDQRTEGDALVVEQFARFIARQFKAPFADELHRPAPVVLPAIDHRAQIREQRAQAPPARTQRVFVAAAIRNVVRKTHCADQFALVVGDAMAAQFDVDQGFIGADHASFGIELADVAIEHARQLRAQRLAILRMEEARKRRTIHAVADDAHQVAPCRIRKDQMQFAVDAKERLRQLHHDVLTIMLDLRFVALLVGARVRRGKLQHREVRALAAQRRHRMQAERAVTIRDPQRTGGAFLVAAGVLKQLGQIEQRLRMNEVVERHADDIIDIGLPVRMLEKRLVDEHERIAVEQHGRRGKIRSERAQLRQFGAGRAAPRRASRARCVGHHQKPRRNGARERRVDIQQPIHLRPDAEPRHDQRGDGKQQQGGKQIN